MEKHSGKVIGRGNEETYGEGDRKGECRDIRRGDRKGLCRDIRGR